MFRFLNISSLFILLFCSGIMNAQLFTKADYTKMSLCFVAGAADAVVKNTSTLTNVTSSGVNNTGTCISGVHTVYAKSGTDIKYIMSYASSGGTAMEYELNITVIKL